MKHVKTPWVEQETELLIKLWASGCKANVIAKQLNREPAKIRAKISRLRTTRPELKDLLPYRITWRGSKLKRRDIPKIRKDNRSLRLIGEQYGVSAVTIYKAKNGETWRNA